MRPMTGLNSRHVILVDFLLLAKFNQMNRCKVSFMFTGSVEELAMNKYSNFCNGRNSDIQPHFETQ
jgi:hypothetical protein